MAGFGVAGKKPKQQPMQQGVPPSAQTPGLTNLPKPNTGVTGVPAAASKSGGNTAGFGVVKSGGGLAVGGSGPVGGFGGMPSIGSLPSAPGVNLTASSNPALEALSERYKKYLDNLEGNTGQIMDQAGQRLRDAREGGRQSLMQTQGLRGVSSSPATAKYEADTQRGVQGAISDIATERERTLGAALGGGVGVFGAPANLALQEKGLGLNAWQAQQQAQMNQFQMWQALLNAQRNSPLGGVPGGGGGPYIGSGGSGVLWR
jgi:hypothetical protein